jgi:hypothetical protein
MESKKCNKCGVEKMLCDFYNKKDTKDGKTNICIDCTKIVNKLKYEANKEEYQKSARDYYYNNKENVLVYKKEFYKDNHNKFLIKNKTYYQKNKEEYKDTVKNYYQNNKEIKKIYNKNYFLENKEKIKNYKLKYHKNRRETDIVYKINHNIRSLISQTFKHNGFNKSAKSAFILGCSYQEFKEYLESNFEPWMNWSNYGLYNGQPNYGWDIDHKIPTSSAKSEDDIIRLNHYSNLQPLCSHLNRNIKRNNIISS